MDAKEFAKLTDEELLQIATPVRCVDCGEFLAENPKTQCEPLCIDCYYKRASVEIHRHPLGLLR